jgi:riboflavin synthase
MFTGLIQEVGETKGMALSPAGATISVATSLAPEIAVGDSVAVNGVCLTATAVQAESFDVEAMNQTLAVTALGEGLTAGRLNLELAMQATDRLGGHIVQGHVDGVGEVAAVTDDGFARRIRVALGPELLRYTVDKGSIALNGVSLTIAELGPQWVEVSLIPETLERTNLGELAPGSKLNVECDIVAKYVERLLAPFPERNERER